MSLRQCSAAQCEKHLHHCCFTGWCAKHGVEDPEGNASFCWSCVLQTPGYAAAVGAASTTEPRSTDRITDVDDKAKEGDGLPQGLEQSGGSDSVEVEQVRPEAESTNKSLTSACDAVNGGTQVAACKLSLRFDGCRVLMAFGLPAKWYGGVLRCIGGSPIAYIGFDDGELRKFDQGTYTCPGQIDAHQLAYVAPKRPYIPCVCECAEELDGYVNTETSSSSVIMHTALLQTRCARTGHSISHGARQGVGRVFPWAC